MQVDHEHQKCFLFLSSTENFDPNPIKYRLLSPTECVNDVRLLDSPMNQQE